MERKKSPNTPQEAEIQCGVPHLCGVLGLFFRIGATSTLRKTMRSSAGCGIPHGANFRILQSSASCGVPQDAEFSILIPASGHALCSCHDPLNILTLQFESLIY